MCLGYTNNTAIGTQLLLCAYECYKSALPIISEIALWYFCSSIVHQAKRQHLREFTARGPAHSRSILWIHTLFPLLQTLHIGMSTMKITALNLSNGHIILLIAVHTLQFIGANVYVGPLYREHTDDMHASTLTHLLSVGGWKKMPAHASSLAFSIYAVCFIYISSNQIFRERTSHFKLGSNGV